MKAARITEYGDSSVVKITDIDKPAAKGGQIVVRVYAASLNPFDTMVRAGYLQRSIPLELPVTLGGDIAGEIVEISDDVTNSAIGDIVYGQANVVAGNSGALAEYAATAVNQVAKAPSNISVQEVASLPLVGVSALQGLTRHINLQAGQKLLITGGSGGIGRIAIQIAKHLGAYVATTATGEGLEVARLLGADEVIDYKTQNVAEVLSDYDAVFDTVGGEHINDLLTVLKRDGVAVTMAGAFDEAKVNDAGVTALSQSTHMSTELLDELTKLVEADVVKPGVGKVFNLDDIQAAFDARDNGTIKGKIVVAIR